MIDKYIASTWGVDKVHLVQKASVLKELVPHLDLEKIHATYILLSEVDRLALLEKRDVPVKILRLHQTAGTLWNKSGEYQQEKGKEVKNYNIMPYASQVGNLKKWLKIDYLKKSDADNILNTEHVFSNPMPFPTKLAIVYLTDSQHYIITTHALLRDVLKSDLLNFAPLTEDVEFWMKLYAWSSPKKAATLIEKLKVVNKYRLEYKASIIRGTNTAEPALVQEGLDRIYETSKLQQFDNQLVKIGFIKDSEIPILIEIK